MIDYKKIDASLRDLVQIQSNKPIECVVYANNFLSLKRIIRQYDNVTYLPFINAFAVNLYSKDIYNLAKVGVVKNISKQSKVFTQIAVSKDIINTQSFYQKGIFGKGVTVAVIDTGIDYHLDFCLKKNRVIKFVDLINNKKKAYDDNGHGTFVSSIFGGSGISSGLKYSGIAPMCNIIAIKALEKNGETSSVNILKAMQWVFDNHKKYNIKVVCMSFGSSPIGRNDPLVLGAETLWNNGIVVVAAAGNSGPEKESIKSPGVSPKIITVGGLDDKRINDKFDENLFEIAKFSSRGPAGYFFKPDCVTSSVEITGVLLGGGYCKMSGTSVATPIIAGVVALLIEKNPDITPDQVKVRLLNNCKRIIQDRNQEGFGYLKIINLI